MLQQQYGWMLALAVAWRQNTPSAKPDDDGRLLLGRVNVQGGIFQHAPAQSANDQAIAALIIFVWFCAIYRAKVARFCSNLGYFVPNQKWAELSTDPSNDGASRAIAGYFTPCQMNSPPTTGSMLRRSGYSITKPTCHPLKAG